MGTTQRNASPTCKMVPSSISTLIAVTVDGSAGSDVVQPMLADVTASCADRVRFALVE